jgi:hypothetical protein
MPRFHFHVDDGSLIPDTNGSELDGIAEARAEAITLAGGLLKDLDGRF